MRNYLKIDNQFGLKKILQNDSKNGKQQHSNLKFLSLASLNIGVYLITPILLGVIIGYNLDRYLKSKPIFTLLFILLGTFSSLYNLFRLTKE